MHQLLSTPSSCPLSCGLTSEDNPSQQKKNVVALLMLPSCPSMGHRPYGIRWVLLVSAVAFSPLGKPKQQARAVGADKGAQTPASPCCSLCTEHCCS